jgi:hypothetical protein
MRVWSRKPGGKVKATLPWAPNTPPTCRSIRCTAPHHAAERLRARGSGRAGARGPSDSYPALLAARWCSEGARALQRSTTLPSGLVILTLGLGKGSRRWGQAGSKHAPPGGTGLEAGSKAPPPPSGAHARAAAASWAR